MTFDYSYTGNLSLLERPKVAFFASRVVPQVIHDQALEWAKQCCDTDRVVISGFHYSKLAIRLFGAWGAGYTIVIPQRLS